MHVRFLSKSTKDHSLLSFLLDSSCSLSQISKHIKPGRLSSTQQHDKNLSFGFILFFYSDRTSTRFTSIVIIVLAKKQYWFASFNQFNKCSSSGR